MQEEVPWVKIDPDHSAQMPVEAETLGETETPVRAERITQLVIEMQRSGDISTFFIHAVAAKVGMNPTDLKVLSILSRQGPLSAGRIAELTGLSHTRVNQILGTGTKRPPSDIHFPAGFLPPPTTVALAALRVIAEEGPRAWRSQQIASELADRGWPSGDLDSVLVDLVTDGVLLSVDGGYFTLHGYGAAGQTAPSPSLA